MKTSTKIIVVFMAALALWWVFSQKWLGEEVAPAQPSVPDTDLIRTDEEAPSSVMSAAQGPEVSMEEEAELRLRFGQSLQQLSQCLNISVAVNDPAPELLLVNLEEALAGDLGGSVVTESEWKSTDLRMADGESRRLFIQAVTNEQGEIERRLQYFSTDSEGVTTQLPLAEEQSVNPSETLLASLEADGLVTRRSEARKIFYQNGDELHVAENQEKIYFFELNHEGRIFRCTGFDRIATVDCLCL